MHTYSTFFLDRGEIWLVQPTIDRYENLIAEQAKSHNKGGPKEHKMGMFEKKFVVDGGTGKDKIWHNSVVDDAFRAAHMQAMGSSVLKISLVASALFMMILGF